MLFRTLARNERGSALVISLLILLVLTGLGVAHFSMSTVEKKISSNNLRSTQAFYNAEAGLAEGLRMVANSQDSLYTGPAWGDWDTNPGWGVYIVNEMGDSQLDPDYDLSLTDGLDNDGDGVSDEAGEHYPEVLTVQGPDRIDYPYVKVRYRLNSDGNLVYFGDHDADVTTAPVRNLDQGAPVLLVSALGAQGDARRTIEMEAVRSPLTSAVGPLYVKNANQIQIGWRPDPTKSIKSSKVPTPPASVTVIDGRDHDLPSGVLQAGNPGTPALGVAGGVGGTDINTDNSDLIPGPGDPTTLALEYDLADLANQIRPKAETVVNAGTYWNVSWGDWNNIGITYCPGDLRVEGTSSGAGILLVDGNFDPRGDFTWDGLILVLGDMDFNLDDDGSGKCKSGKGYCNVNLSVNGSVLVEGTSTTNYYIGACDDQTSGVYKKCMKKRWNKSGKLDKLVPETINIEFSAEALARLADYNFHMMGSWREL